MSIACMLYVWVESSYYNQNKLFQMITVFRATTLIPIFIDIYMFVARGAVYNIVHVTSMYQCLWSHVWCFEVRKLRSTYNMFGNLRDFMRWHCVKCSINYAPNVQFNENRPWNYVAASIIIIVNSKRRFKVPNKFIRIIIITIKGWHAHELNENDLFLTVSILLRSNDTVPFYNSSDLLIYAHCM